MGPGGRAAVWLQEAALGAEHHQTLTALSPSFLGVPLPPQADGSILAPLGIPEGAEPAGPQEAVLESPPRQRRIGAAGQSGPDRRALGSLSRSQVLLRRRQ